MKRRTLLILFVLLVAGVGLFVWKSSRDAQAETFVMVDGTQITFQAVTVGTNQSQCFGNPFQRMAARIPGRLGEILHGGTVFRFATPSPTDVLFWFRLRENSALTNVNLVPPASGASSKVYYRIKLKDDQGNELQGYTGRRFGQFPSGEFALFVHSTNVPAISRMVLLRLESWHGPSDWRESGEILAPNPLYRKEP